MEKQKSLKLNAALNFIKCFMNIIFPIISFPYASRILMPEGIGRVNFANNIIEYFLMMAELGITTYATREAAKIRDDKTKLSKFTQEILAFNFITTIFSCSLLVISLLVVPKFADYRILLIICSTKVLFTTVGIDWLYKAKEEFAYITIRHTGFQVISLVLLFTLVKTPEDYLWYAGIGVFSNVGANIFNFIYSRKFVNLLQKSKLEIMRHVKPVMTFFGVNCANKINGILDSIMLGFIAGDAAVGFYSAATKLEKMVRELITSVISIFMPRTAYLIEQNKKEEYQQLVNKVFGVTFFFSVPAAVGLFTLATPLTLIFCGEQYLPAVNTMQLLSFAIIILTFNSYLNNLILTPLRLEKFMLYAQIVGLIANVTLNYIFISKWGVFGAGLATFIVELILPIVKLIPSWKYIKYKSNLFDMIKSIAGATIMWAVIYFAFKNIESNWIRILASMGTGAGVYAVSELILQHPTAKMIAGIFVKKMEILI